MHRSLHASVHARFEQTQAYSARFRQIQAYSAGLRQNSKQAVLTLLAGWLAPSRPGNACVSWIPFCVSGTVYR